MHQPKENKDATDYILSLNEKERRGYEIAKQCLGCAFSLEKSTGYIHYTLAKSAKK